MVNSNLKFCFTNDHSVQLFFTNLHLKKLCLLFYSLKLIAYSHGKRSIKPLSTFLWACWITQASNFMLVNYSFRSFTFPDTRKCSLLHASSFVKVKQQRLNVSSVCMKHAGCWWPRERATECPQLLDTRRVCWSWRLALLILFPFSSPGC